MVRLAKYFALFAFSLALALPAYAQSPIQLRFNVQPAASDPIWQSFKGQTLEKYAECYYSNEASRPAGWNPGRGNIFSGKTVLFNPGNTTWSGGKQVFTPNTPPEPTNTLLMIPIGLNAQTKSIVCRTRILANGQNVSGNVNDIVFRLTDEVAKSGPPTANVTLDVSKIADATTKLWIAELRSLGTQKTITAKSGEKIFDNPASCVGPDKIGGGSNFYKPGCLFEVFLVVKRDTKLGNRPVVIRTTSPGNSLQKTAAESSNKKNSFASGKDEISASVLVYVFTGPDGQKPGVEYCAPAEFKVEPDPANAKIAAASFKTTFCVKK
jgi:hypothetical protein